MEELRQFISVVRESNNLWLLEAKPGLFAMVEDGDENSFIPVWSSEQSALADIGDDWQGYNVTNMSIEEFVGWMNELHADNIGIAVSVGNEGQMLPVPAQMMKLLFVGTETNVEEDKKLVGEYYDEEWAEGIPDNWEEEYLDNLDEEELDD